MAMAYDLRRELTEHGKGFTCYDTGQVTLLHLIIGRIGRAHGVGGDVTVEIRTDEPERRFMPGTVLLTDPPSAGPLTIENSRMSNATLLLRFQGVQNRDAAQALRDTLLLVEVDIDKLSEDPDEFYDHQLVGLKVVTEDGIEVGRITEPFSS
ncbi:16S rRNA processing protein RimM [Streptomyces sp. SAI-163]